MSGALELNIASISASFSSRKAIKHQLQRDLASISDRTAYEILALAARRPVEDRGKARADSADGLSALIPVAR